MKLALRDIGHAPSPSFIAEGAVDALIAEARLTPKPALVDERGSGAHRDLDLDTMLRSAHALQPTFLAIARAAHGVRPSQALREQLARIGREGEAAMMHATNGSNAHRGAIWIVGLLCAGAAMHAPEESDAICFSAADIARFEDRYAPASATASHGARVTERYRVAGARGEARNAFPHARLIGLPALDDARARGLDKPGARLDALVAIMASLDDTCLLHRGGMNALDAAQRGARDVLRHGGAGTNEGRAALARLDAELLALNASPGGAADLLAATLFLDSLRRLA
ncbi:triphosphoribosyl-dephospho-CoA synthase [Caballeronia novacaledonica]|uniref:Probable 2-(5''-triphosphoribosyl)-3'-dephosphocoenzyme-A synthase n=1 Tax=Caballeronia novacaledonica TaxID=1544861 RepID=A0A2U3I9E2_9BURK|nr:triphosphoribosyl-dephospho-CoA synthase [Caballeronia novacaledonica]SPB16812.1 triphosphoribosyl-dephospho-CoA synthase [Caballeronia novacaledonica]